MGKQLFKIPASRMTTSLERKATQERIKVTTTIRRICEKKRADKVDPPRATWRELRDALTADEQMMLSRLVKVGVVRATQAINYDTYEVDEQRLIAFEREITKFDK